MKQATVKLPSGEFCFQEVPEGVQLEVVNFEGIKSWIRWFTLSFSDNGNIDLPPGSWQLLGADPTNLTEDEAAQVVGEPNALYEYPDYQNNELCLLSTALESYSSLLAANGHKVGECVTLKKVK